MKSQHPTDKYFEKNHAATNVVHEVYAPDYRLAQTARALGE
jgi:hypothetical protein